MRTLFLSATLGLLLSSTAFAGGVKIKKGIVSVEDTPVFQYEGALRVEGATAMVHSAKTNEPLFTVHTVAFWDGWTHVDVKFVGGSAYPYRLKVMNYKQLFAKLHENGIVDGDGHLDLAKGEEYGKMYGIRSPM